MPVFTLPKSSHPDFALPNVKPKGPVLVDWGEPLSKGLLSCVLFRAGEGDVTRLRTATSTTGTNSIDMGVHSGVQSGKTVGSEANAHIDFLPTMTFTVDDPWTIVLRLRCDGAANSGMSAGQRGDTSSYIWARNGTDVIINTEAGSTTFFSGTADLTVMTDVVVTSTGEGTTNSTLSVYLDGVKESTGSLSTGFILNALFTAHTNHTLALNGLMELGYVYNRTWSDNDVATYRESRYQILKPAIPLTYFVPAAAAAGGNEPLFYHHQRMLSRCS